MRRELLAYTTATLAAGALMAGCSAPDLSPAGLYEDAWQLVVGEPTPPINAVVPDRLPDQVARQLGSVLRVDHLRNIDGHTIIWQGSGTKVEGIAITAGHVVLADEADPVTLFSIKGYDVACDGEVNVVSEYNRGLGQYERTNTTKMVAQFTGPALESGSDVGALTVEPLAEFRDVISAHLGGSPQVGQTIYEANYEPTDAGQGRSPNLDVAVKNGSPELSHPAVYPAIVLQQQGDKIIVAEALKSFGDGPLEETTTRQGGSGGAGFDGSGNYLGETISVYKVPETVDNVEKKYGVRVESLPGDRLLHIAIIQRVTREKALALKKALNAAPQCHHHEMNFVEPHPR